MDERSFAEELRGTLGHLAPTQVSLIDAPARADVVIDGTIRQAEDGVRVIVSLTDAKSQTRIWSETVQRPATRKEGMAVEVAHRVTREIARRFLPPPEHEPPLETKAKASAVALYRRARLLHSRSQAYDWMRTKELYEAAIREEPRFAEAWSGLSDVWAGQALGGPIAECDRAAARATDCARRAVALQPRNAEAHSTLGLLAAQRNYDLAAAEDELRRGAAGDPNYVDGRVNLAMVLTMRGQTEESLREFALAQQLDPVDLDLSPIEPLLYLHARRYEDARARYREILAVNPESKAAAWGLLYTYIAQKNWREALKVAAMIQKPVETNVPPTEAGFLKVYRGFETWLQEGRRREVFNDYFLALYYAQLGDRDRAFELLNRAIDVRVPVISYIMVDPRLDNLRSDARFKAVLARLDLARPPAGG
jgi:tetratricopeptide (TPR) repeat protein